MKIRPIRFIEVAVMRVTNVSGNSRRSNARGATLADMAQIVTDHAVPFPTDLLWLANGHPDDADAN